MDKSRYYAGAFVTADAPARHRQRPRSSAKNSPIWLRQMDAADKQALEELAALSAERVDLHRRLAELQAKIDAMKKAKS